MPIIQIAQPSALTPVQSQVNRIIQLNTQLFNFNKATLLQIINIIWGSNGVSPQQIFDSFGTESAQLFQAANAIASLIQMVDPSFVLPTPPLPFTLNPDGTVTVGTPNTP